MRVRTWILLSMLGVVAAVVAVVLALSSDPDPAEARVAGPGSSTVTEDGVRWRFDGRSIVVTVTAEAPARVRRSLRKEVAVACSRVPTLGSPGKPRTGIATARFTKIPGTLRVRLEPRITRADECVVERRGDGEDVAGVRFPANAYASSSGGEPPSDADRAAIVATLDQYFAADAARDRPRECATYTPNAARAVAAVYRRGSRRTDCVGAYRAFDREVDRFAPEDSRVPLAVDTDVQRALGSPGTLDLKVKDGRARVSNSGTPLDYGFELVLVGDRWLIDRLPR